MNPLACILALPLLAAASPATHPAPATAPAATTPATLTYTDDAHTFFLTLPATWQQGKLPPGRGGMLLVGPGPTTRPDARPLVRVQARALRPGVTEQALDQEARALAAEVTRSGIDDVKVEPARLDGVDARTFTVTRTDSRQVQTQVQYLVALRPPRMFLFTYLQDKSLFDPADARAVFDAVRWNKQPPKARQQP